jgi:hypothetical protein
MFLLTDFSSKESHPSDSDPIPHKTVQFFTANGQPTKGLAHIYDTPQPTFKGNARSSSTKSTVNYSQDPGDTNHPSYAKRYDNTKAFGGMFEAPAGSTAAAPKTTLTSFVPRNIKRPPAKTGASRLPISRAQTTLAPSTAPAQPVASTSSGGYAMDVDDGATTYAAPKSQGAEGNDQFTDEPGSYGQYGYEN